MLNLKSALFFLFCRPRFGQVCKIIDWLMDSGEDDNWWPNYLQSESSIKSTMLALWYVILFCYCCWRFTIGQEYVVLQCWYLNWLRMLCRPIWLRWPVNAWLPQMLRSATLLLAFWLKKDQFPIVPVDITFGKFLFSIIILTLIVTMALRFNGVRLFLARKAGFRLINISYTCLLSCSPSPSSLCVDRHPLWYLYMTPSYLMAQNGDWIIIERRRAENSAY